MLITGSCLCGQVRYQIDGPIRMMNNCHCSMCRKVHGAAFGSFLHANSDGFRWVSGVDLIETYQATKHDDRCFCSNCGSNVPVIEEIDNNVIVPAGTLDSDPGIKPIVHIFTGSRAPWYEITDSLPQFKEFAPEEWIQEVFEKK